MTQAEALANGWQVVAALIFGSGVVGAVVGAWLAGKRWLREARHRAYADLLTALDNIASKSGDVAARRFKGDPREAFMETAADSWTTANRVRLVGPKPVSELGHTAVEYCLRQWSEPPDKEWDRLREDFVASASRVVQRPIWASLRRHRP